MLWGGCDPTQDWGPDVQLPCQISKNFTFLQTWSQCFLLISYLFKTEILQGRKRQGEQAGMLPGLPHCWGCSLWLSRASGLLETRTVLMAGEKREKLNWHIWRIEENGIVLYIDFSERKQSLKTKKRETFVPITCEISEILCWVGGDFSQCWRVERELDFTCWMLNAVPSMPFVPDSPSSSHTDPTGSRSQLGRALDTGMPS